MCGVPSLCPCWDRLQGTQWLASWGQWAAGAALKAYAFSLASAHQPVLWQMEEDRREEAGGERKGRGGNKEVQAH